MPSHNVPSYVEQRDRMVRYQIASRGVVDPRVLDAMGLVPREVFVPERMRELAYEDTPLPIEEAQTISQPYIVAIMEGMAFTLQTRDAVAWFRGAGDSKATFRTPT